MRTINLKNIGLGGTQGAAAFDVIPEPDLALSDLLEQQLNCEPQEGVPGDLQLCRYPVQFLPLCIAQLNSLSLPRHMRSLRGHSLCASQPDIENGNP